MGLDMYLNAKRYLSPFTPDEKTISQRISEIIGVTPEADDLNAFGRVSEVTIGVGYWRKANAVHAWLVANVQQGEDDCGNYTVDREQLIELRDICGKVITEPKMAAELLPCQRGLFFGSTEYDEYYMHDLEHTVAIVTKTLQLSDDWTMEYHSSW